MSRRTTKQRRAARFRRCVVGNMRWTPTRYLLHGKAVMACRLPWPRLQAQGWLHSVNMDALERAHA